MILKSFNIHKCKVAAAIRLDLLINHTLIKNLVSCRIYIYVLIEYIYIVFKCT